jgi:L-fuconolactonase
MTLTVDAHHHLWDLSVRAQDWIDPATMPAVDRSFAVDDLAPVLAANAIDRTVLVQTVTDPDETPELLALADTTPWIGAVVGWVDLTAPDVAERLSRLREAPGGRYLAGIRHQVQHEPDPDWLRRADVRAGLRAVGDAGLLYELLTLPHQLDAAIATVDELDDVTFVVDHLSKPAIRTAELRPWLDRMLHLAARPNVACKLSGLGTEAHWDRWTVADLRPFAEPVLDAFGPDRVLFGSDWPVCTLAGGYERTLAAAHELTADLDADERAQVFGANAVLLYGCT